MREGTLIASWAGHHEMNRLVRTGAIHLCTSVWVFYLEHDYFINSGMSLSECTNVLSVHSHLILLNSHANHSIPLSQEDELSSRGWKGERRWAWFWEVQRSSSYGWSVLQLKVTRKLILKKVEFSSQLWHRLPLWPLASHPKPDSLLPLQQCKMVQSDPDSPAKNSLPA